MTRENGRSRLEGGGGRSRGDGGIGGRRTKPKPRRPCRPRKPTSAAKSKSPATVEARQQGQVARPGRPASPDVQRRRPPTELDALAKLPNEGLWSVGGRELKLTNLDKALFAPLDGTDDPPITKRELIAYFARIAPAMLPHLAERPLNLQRFPNGVGGPSFWQKDIPSTAPDWLRRWQEVGVDAREANTHLVAESVAALCWLGNQAAFEIHAWTGRLERRTGRRSPSSTSIPARRRRGTRRSSSPGSTGPRSSTSGCAPTRS